MSTIKDLLQTCPLPAIEARMLMQAASQLSRTQLISRSLDALPANHAAAFVALVQRRVLGEPIAYILGHKEFYGRNFIVSPAVLIPRPDTETLIDTLLEIYHAQRTAPLRVLDLGTGSGAIAVTLALECPAWHVSAVDISADALAIARRNALALGAQVNFTQSNWLNSIPKTMQFDLIVSNPPYIEADDAHLSQGDLVFEPRLALTDEQNGLNHYQRLVDTVPQYLSAGGQLWFEHGYNQAAQITGLLEAANFQQIETRADLGEQLRVTGGTYIHRTKKG
jgi:release factor glutamine methyltransferase